MSAPNASRYEMVVSVDAAVRLRTATKAYCNCAVAPGDDEPNAHACPVCLALPGALPVLNERAVELGVRAALALGCAVAPVSEFARRHHFTAESPAGYELTQHERPLAAKGNVQIGETREGGPLTVRVTRVRLGEEGGRVTHGRFPRASALDLNLAGAPVLHVSTAPEMYSSAEVVAFVRELRRLVRGVAASDARLQDGSLRVRAALSVRRLGDTGLAAPCDVDGGRSLTELRAALEREFARQSELAGRGGSAANPRADGRAAAGGPAYLPEPDLPPLVLTAEWIAEQRRYVPAQPASRRVQLAREFGIGGGVLDALAGDPELADYYASAARVHGDPNATADWVLGPVLAALGDDGDDLDAYALRVRPADLAALLDMVRDGALGEDDARRAFAIMARTGEPPARVAKREKLGTAGDA